MTDVPSPQRGAAWVERLALLLLRIGGALALVASIAMLVLGPRGPARANLPGFTNPVVSFELASEPAQVFDLLGAPGDPDRGEAVRRMDLANRIDFLFMVGYSTIYAGIGLLVLARRRAGRAGFRLVLGLAVLMLLADALENRRLLILSELTDPAAMTAPLEGLRVFTLLKWWSLFVASAIVAAAIRRDRSWWRWSALLFAGAAAVGFGSPFHLPAIEWTAAPLAGAWTATWIHALTARPAAG